MVSSGSTTKTMVENIVGSLVTSIKHSSKLQKTTEIKKAEIELVLSSQRNKISTATRAEIFENS